MQFLGFILFISFMGYGIYLAEENEAKNKISKFVAEVFAGEDSINAGVLVDKNGVIVQWSKPAEKMFGITAEAAEGLKVEKLMVNEKDKERHKVKFKDWMKSGKLDKKVVVIECDVYRIRRGEKQPFKVNIRSYGKEIDGERFALGVFTEAKNVEIAGELGRK